MPVWTLDLERLNLLPLECAHMIQNAVLIEYTKLNKNLQFYGEIIKSFHFLGFLELILPSRLFVISTIKFFLVLKT